MLPAFYPPLNYINKAAPSVMIHKVILDYVGKISNERLSGMRLLSAAT